MKTLKWTSTILTAFVMLACMSSVFLTIWSTGDYWPSRFGWSALVLIVIALPLWLATLFLWENTNHE